MEKQHQRQCSVCKKSLPATDEYYDRDPDSLDGLTSVCKLCRMDPDTGKRIADKNDQPGKKAEFPKNQEAKKIQQDAPLVMKKCPDCKKMKPSDEEHFNKNTMSRDGLTHICKTCFGDRMAERQRKSPAPKPDAWPCFLGTVPMKSGDHRITIDFSKHPQHYEQLMQQAEDNLRSIENQALWFLINGFEALAKLEGDTAHV